MSGKALTRLSVICPWCLGKEKTFTRVNDLKQHVTVTHRNIISTLPSSFFSVGTGFFLAKYPDDYRRIVEVSPYENDECFEARKVVLRWCASQLNAAGVSQMWRNGWLKQRASEKPNHAVKRSATVSSSKSFLPDFGVDPQVQVDAEVTIKKSRTVRPLEYSSDSSSDSVSTSDPKSPKDFSAVALDVLPSGDYRDVHISSSTIQEPVPAAPSEEAQPTVAATDEHTEEDPLPPSDREVQVNPMQEDVTLNQEEPAASSSSSSVPNSRPTTLQERARHLLKYGQLPHFAPGRRDWTRAGLVSLDFGGRSFPWPPHGWQEMDPDRRLLSAEFAAMTLEFSRRGGFPCLSRSDLLDRYNFLILPGSAKIKRSQEDSRRCKSRFYTYQELRRISLSTAEIKEDVDFVVFFEKGKTEAATDEIVDGLESLKVPLRLEKYTVQEKEVLFKITCRIVGDQGLIIFFVTSGMLS